MMSFRVHWRVQHAVSYTVQPEWEVLRKHFKEREGKKEEKPAGWGSNLRAARGLG